MPLHHHGGTPHTKTQQRKRTDEEVTLEEAAGQAQHDIGAEPFNDGRWDRAVDDHNAGYRPAPTTGGTMSAQESAARLIQLAESTNAKGLAQEIIADLGGMLEAIVDALGGGHSRLQEALGPIQEVRAHAELLAVMLDGAFDMVADVGRSIA